MGIVDGRPKLDETSPTHALSRLRFWTKDAFAPAATLAVEPILEAPARFAGSGRDLQKRPSACLGESAEIART